MIRVIVDNHVHRLRQDGIMESAPTHVSKEGNLSVRDKEFEMRAADSMGMTGAEYSYLRREIQNLSIWFPKDRRPGLPTSEPVGEKPVLASDVRE